MKFLAALASALGAVSVASAAANPRPADVLKARQFNPRQLADVCANVDAELKVDVLGIAVAVGLLDVCLCISAIPTFIETNLIAQLGVTLGGESAVSAAIEALINGAADHKSCSYPTHSTPACDAGNPCGFTCPAGTTPQPPTDPTACVGSGPSGAAKKKRDVNWWQDAACPGASFSACGIPGGMKSAKAYECVETMRDIESCGGCLIPLHPSAPKGVDCTEIPGVDAVACLSGACAIQACLPGWHISPAGDACTRSAPESHHTMHVDHMLDEAILLKAVEYGLEHMPLKN